MLVIFGYLGAILIGLTLGLIGSGGSILTVPILVYLMGIDPVPATAYSLFIVGLTSLIGSFTYMKRKLISYVTAVVFAAPALVTVFMTRKFIIPALPEHIATIAGFNLTRDIFIMALFAVLMIGASLSMIKDKRTENENREISYNYTMVLLEGVVVGLLAGLVGAGGGFLIIPALVLLVGLPMKKAVGTSLLIIAVNSLIGFTGDIGTNVNVDWMFLSSFSLLAIAGIFIGSYLTKFIKGTKLKPAFGYFVLMMGVYILGKEIFMRF